MQKTERQTQSDGASICGSRLCCDGCLSARIAMQRTSAVFLAWSAREVYRQGAQHWQTRLLTTPYLDQPCGRPGRGQGSYAVTQGATGQT